MQPPIRASNIDRRSFVKTLSAAGLGLAVGTARAQESASAAPPAPRFAIVGTGWRHRMYRDALLGDYRDQGKLVALCDVNPGRLQFSRGLAAEAGVSVPGFEPENFEKMIRETKPDHVIVTTVDATHDEFIVRAMEAGCDVLTEKPMTTTAEQCQRILDAKKRTGRNVRVTFNYRFAPSRTQVKDLLMSGAIGDILSVDFHWLLNTSHGADYFRRWHSRKQNSGGLMVHKASHHFDLVNWWLGATPESVWAVGKREFYTPATAKRLGLQSHHERCHTCPETDKCTFFLDLAAMPKLKPLYLDQEHHDGYFRDQCVWRPEIDIEDTMNVIVKYDTGATLSYSLNACNAWEGYHIAFNGTQGRLEHSIFEKMYVKAGNGMVDDKPGGTKTRLFPLRGEPVDIEPWVGTGGHEGGDKLMLDRIFAAAPPEDKYRHDADERGGAAAILVGVAANRCFQTGQPVRIADLVPDLPPQDFAPMPTRKTRLKMPPRRVLDS